MTKFGPAGNSAAFYASGHKYTYQEGEFLSKLGLNAFEYSFGRGAHISDIAASQIKEKFVEYGIAVSCHAPYYINFASLDDDAIAKSIGYIISSVKAVIKMGGNRVIFHAGSCGKQPREAAIERVRQGLSALDRALDENNVPKDIILCPETMGKDVQIGNYEEIVQLCKLSPRFYPCFDFGHINCIMRGGLDSAEKFGHIFDYAIQELGLHKVKNCHIHFSKIEFGHKGEIRHTTFADTRFGPEPMHLIEAVKRFKLTPVIICESKDTMSDDAFVLKELYAGY